MFVLNKLQLLKDKWGTHCTVRFKSTNLRCEESLCQFQRILVCYQSPELISVEREVFGKTVMLRVYSVKNLISHEQRRVTMETINEGVCGKIL